MTDASIVVIGHVDHGKTALVRALTGMETDRLAEEKARGLSITAGYAHKSYPAGTLDFIDAPGHADFIPAMVAGASGARMVLVVISAVEGIGGQTLEHLAIAKMLGITTGVLAITKCDLIDPLQRDARRGIIRRDLANTGFADLPVVMCSAVTGRGIETLHDALSAILSSPCPMAGPLHSFLPIDRGFSIAGRGTIATGTLLGQDLTLNSDAVLLPEGRRVILRGLHCRGQPQQRAQAGTRTAVNLRGVSVAQVPRGAVLCGVDTAIPSMCIDIAFEVLPTCKQLLKHNEDIRVLFGTSSEVVSLRLFGGGQRGAGSTGFAQLRFKSPVVGFGGQRAVLRRLSPAQTIAGAVFLDPQSVLARAGDTRRMAVLEAVQNGGAPSIALALSDAHAGVCEVVEVARLSRCTPQSARALVRADFEEIGMDLIAPTSQLKTCTSQVLQKLAAYHARYPLHIAAPRSGVMGKMTSPALFDHVVRALISRRKIQPHGTRLALHGHDPLALLTPDQHARLTAIEAEFKAATLAPPAADTVAQGPLDRDLLQLCIDIRRIVELRNVALNQTLLLHSDTVRMAANTLRAAFPAPQLFSTSKARVLLRTSRRVIVPLLEHFDAQNVSLRTGNSRHMAPAISVPPSEPP